MPIPSLKIALYLEHLKQTSEARGTISNALVSIKWLHYFVPGLNSLNNPLNDEFLSKIVEGRNRNKAKMKTRKKPFSTEIIHGFLKSLPENPTLTQLRNTLIPVLAFALLLRHDETSHLNCNHFTILDHGLKILIPSSKTDNFREGKFVFLSKDNHSLYDLFFKYLEKANLHLSLNHFLFGPLEFDKSSKKYVIKNEKLSYNVFNKIVKDAVTSLGLDPNDYGTHSARSGGATTLAPHISQFNLMLTGRWSDPRSIGSYVETSTETRFELNSILDINI